MQVLEISLALNVLVIYIKCFLFYARVNDQFKTTELENVEKLLEQTDQALKSC